MMVPPMVAVTVAADMQLDARTISIVLATAVMMVPMAVTVVAAIATVVTATHKLRGRTGLLCAGYACGRRR
jgi:hypothetical protein